MKRWYVVQTISRDEAHVAILLSLMDRTVRVQVGADRVEAL